jgi:MFS family permease
MRKRPGLAPTVSGPGGAPLELRTIRDTRLLLVGRFFMSTSQSLSSVAMPVAMIQAGASTGLVGTMLALSTIVGLIETVLVGAYADRGYFCVFLVVLPLTSVLGIAPFMASCGPLLLGLGTIFAGYGGGTGANSGGTGPYQPAEYGWLAHRYGHGSRNRLVSRFSATSVAGVVLASLIALLAPDLSGPCGFGSSQAGQARFLMLLVGLLAVIPTVVGGMVLEPERIPPAWAFEGRAKPGLRQRVVDTFWPHESRALLARLSITGGLNGIAIGSFGAFLSVWLILHFHTTAGTLGLINLIISATAVFGDLTCPWVARKLGLVKAVIVTRSVQSLIIIPIALAPSFTVAAVLLVVRQFAQRLNQPLRDSYTLARSNEREKSRMSAMSDLTNQGMQAVSSQGAGFVVEQIGFTVPFVVAALMQFASGALYFFYFNHQPPPEERESFTEGTGTKPEIGSAEAVMLTCTPSMKQPTTRSANAAPGQPATRQRPWTGYCAVTGRA